MATTNQLLRLLGVQHPIVQAPMVGVSTPALAAAVSNAGGLGSIGIGASDAQQASAMIRTVRTLTDKPFNVNVFCHAPAIADLGREEAWLRHLRPLFAEFDSEPPATLREIYRSFLADRSTLDMLLVERPHVVSFHFGLPPPEWIAALRKAGIVTLACVTTPAEADQAEQAGVDALIAQGVEAGGHRGVFDATRDAQMGLFALLAQTARQTRLPVIAAGGIMDGRGIHAALSLGALAVQMGTAFILCPESAADALYRDALQGERAWRTAITAAISGRPARGLINRLFTDVDSPNAPALPDYPITYDAAKQLHAAAKKRGSNDFAVQWAGQAAPLARAMPAGELVELLVREMHEEQHRAS